MTRENHKERWVHSSQKGKKGKQVHQKRIGGAIEFFDSLPDAHRSNGCPFIIDIWFTQKVIEGDGFFERIAL